MTNITITINKEEVYEEVAKTTEYTGIKMTGDEKAYERIPITDQDKSLLERFWAETKNAAAGNLKNVFDSEEETGGLYTLRLKLSNAFDTALEKSIQRSLSSFFVMSITAKWYTFTNKAEATGCAAEAAAFMDDILRKAYYKKKPVRPTY